MHHIARQSLEQKKTAIYTSEEYKALVERLER
jgi:hypothetical protein